MSTKSALTCFLVIFFLSSVIELHAKKRYGDYDDEEDKRSGFRFKPVVKKEQRKVLVENEFGSVSAIDVGDGLRGPYRIHFFTLEPNSLLLPILLHADMVFFVPTGSGKLTWADEEDTTTVKLRRGDIFRLQAGSVFFVQSDLQTERESLRIYALFSNADDDLFEQEIGAYSNIRNLLRGFDATTLKHAFKVSDEVIESITSAAATEEIVHAIPEQKDKGDEEKKKKRSLWELEDRFLKTYVGGEVEAQSNKKKKKKSKGKGYNLYEEDRDFENCNGWSLVVDSKKADHILGESHIGLFLVNLTKGSMMGPHWNPRATEITIVLQGRGMVRVVCPSSSGTNNKTGSGPMKSACRNRRFMVKEGDVFAVPRFHPMAQLSFNNDSLVFMGFTTTRRENSPQFLAGKQSVLQSLDRDVLALSFNVPNSTIDQIRAPQAESVILDCTSCAEEEERKMEEDEAAWKREKEEEERRKREEEEEREREKEEEERRKREEEEARKREEEAERERERQRQEQEEKERQRQEEEERERQRQEEEEKERQRQEEEERERERQQEEERERERQRQEEEERQRQEEEERVGKATTRRGSQKARAGRKGETETRGRRATETRGGGRRRRRR